MLSIYVCRIPDVNRGLQKLTPEGKNCVLRGTVIETSLDYVARLGRGRRANLHLELTCGDVTTELLKEFELKLETPKLNHTLPRKQVSPDSDDLAAATRQQSLALIGYIYPDIFLSIDELEC